ncbi:amino acid adenylation domain-containing protein [Nocardia cyriacigeorgica]|nr:amino acid adenylation domain-containing protein [Nocardia cyriacigeorgica]
MCERTVSGVFDHWVSARPNATAIREVSGHGVVERTYAELAEQVYGLAAVFDEFEAGQRVPMVLPGGADYVAGFLAAVRAGLIPVPIFLPAVRSAERDLARVSGILSDSDPGLVYTSADLVDVVAANPVLAGFPVVHPDDRRPAVAARTTDAETLAFLQYSSGSTGQPKGVMNTHASILRQIDIVGAVWNRSEDIRTVSWLPLYHDMGMFWGALGPLLCGGTATLIAPHDFIRTPRLWLETVSRFRGNWIAGPDFGYRRCVEAFDDGAVAALDLSGLHVATNGAEPVRADTMNRFTARFRPAGLRAEVMAPQYGLAEAGLCVSGATLRRPYVHTSFDVSELDRGHAVEADGDRRDARVRTMVGCGDDTVGWDVRIVDEKSRTPLPDGRIGEIWVSGAGLPAGYWHRPDQTAQTFGAHLDDGTGPFLRTGDAGFRYRGELYISGRIRDVIIVAGTNHFPNDIEATIERSGCGVRPGGACAVQQGFDAQQWLLLVETDGASEDLDDYARILRRRILAAHDTAPERIIWVAGRTLPTTTSGKIRRAEALRLLEAGELEILHEAPVASSQPRADSAPLVEQLAWMLGLRPEALNPDTDLVALGLTSMMTTRIVEWAAARERRLDFADLYREPTLAQWQRLYDTAPAYSAPAAPTEATHEIATTALQHAYWVGRAPEQPLGGVGCQTYFELSGARIEPSGLAGAVDELVRCHPMLRARFPAPDRCLVDETVPPYHLPVHDLVDSAPGTVRAHLAQVRERLRNHRFDIASGDCWAIELTRTADHAVIHIAIDLIIADITGIGLLLEDLAELYRGGSVAPAPMPIPPVPSIAGSGGAVASASLPEGPRLPRIDESEVVFGRHSFVMDATATAAMDAACRAVGVTRAAALLACFELVLRRWSGDEDFLVTVTTFGRTPEFARTVGDFTETRLQIGRGTSGPVFSTEAGRTQQGLRSALDAPPAGAVLADAVRAGTGHSGLSPVVFTYAADIPLLGAEAAETLGTVAEVRSMTPQVLIDHQVCTLGDSLVLSWDCREGCFPAGVLSEMFDAYRALVTGLGERDWSTDATVRLPDAALAARVRRNDTSAPIPEGSLTDLFRKRVAEHPNRIALSWRTGEFDEHTLTSRLLDRETVTYRELDDHARRVAAALAEQHRPGAVIGIQLPKGPMQIVAVLGTLLAGCVYLPIAMDQPAQRFQRICAGSGLAGVIRYVRNQPREQPAKAVVHDISAMLDHTPGEPRPVDPSGPAYIIYTSGSTGEPKGVVVSHTAALNTVVDINRRNEIGADDAVLAVSGLDFDLSVYDIFGPLSRGARIVTLSDEARRDAFHWRGLILDLGVTVWNSAPGLMEMLLIAAGETPGSLGMLRRVFLSGDWIPLDLPPRLRIAAPRARLVAMGGATEAAIWSNEYVVDEVDSAWASIPYGYPLANQRFRVVDTEGADQPAHVPGELWIGGTGVALGYHHAPERTAERFVRDDDGVRWYRTGDLGCYWADGTLQFLGRIDAQVKVRGYRVECGEIEHVLRSHPAVENAVVVPIRNRSALGAVVVGLASTDVTEEQLRGYAANQLPAYMTPAVVVRTAQLVLTNNGKVDRRWAERLLSEQSAPSVAPGPDTTVERLVAEVWAQVLGIADIDAETNFFALGGDSLRATEVCARLTGRGVLGAEVETLLGRPTLRDFSAACAMGATPPSRPVETGDPVPPQTPFPLTRLQQAYVLGAQGLRGAVRASTVFSIVLGAADGSPIDLDRFAGAVNSCVAEFDILRCRLDNDVRQRVDTHSAPVTVGLIDGIADDPDALLQAMAGLPVELGTAPVIRCFAPPGATTSVGLVINYLALDARSLVTIVSEILDRYAGANGFRKIDPTTEVFRDHAAAGHAPDAIVADDHSGSGVFPPPDLPSHLGPVGESVRFARRTLRVDEARYRALRRIAAERRVTPNAILFEAFTAALHSIGAGDHFAITVPRTHRPAPVSDEIEVLGNFTRLSVCTADYRAQQPGSPAAVYAAHEQLRRAAGAATDATGDLATARSVDPGGYPVVFTSTLGMGRNLAPGVGSDALVKLRTLTQTPGVFLDCQVEDDADGLIVGWDVAAGTIADEAVSQAFSAFEAAVRRQLGQDSAVPTPLGELGVSGPEAIISAALIALAESAVRPEYRLVVERWRSLPSGPPADAAALRAGQRLAAIVSGAATPHRLLDDPDLSPEALLLRDHRTGAALAQLSERIYDHARTLGRRLRIVEVGSGTGRATAELAALVEPVTDSYLALEPDPILTEIATARPVPGIVRFGGRDAVTSIAEVDVVICCGSLHRTEGAAEILTGIDAHPRGWLWLAENSEATPATLVSAAILRPGVLDPATTPLRPADQWWRFLVDNGWQPSSMTTDGPAVVVFAQRGGVGRSTADSPGVQRGPGRVAGATEPSSSVLSSAVAAAAPGITPAAAAESSMAVVPAPAADTVAFLTGLWRRHLGVAEPAVTDDFFLLGGDSLVATRVYSDLRAAGFRVAMVDLFNYPILGDLAARIGTATEPTPDDAVVEHISAEQLREYPLTPVQRAYAAGRVPGYVLSGVAAHCYFEFAVADLDVERLTGAVRELIGRHEGLRTTMSASIATVHEAPIEPVLRTHADVRGAMREQVIDLSVRSGIDVGVQVLDEHRSLVGISMDNAVLDGASMMTALAELDHLYAGRPAAQLPVLTMTFAHYVHRHPALHPDADDTALPLLRASRDYWRARFDTLPTAPALVDTAALVEIERPAFERVTASIPQPRWQRLSRQCRESGVTTTALVLAAYAGELARWSGEDHFCVNVTLFDRDPAVDGIDQVIGDFTSLVLLECRVDPELPLVEQARNIQRQLLADLPHRAADGVWLQRELLRHHGSPADAIFPVVFTSGLGLREISTSGSLSFGEQVFGASQTPQTLLDFQVWEDAGELRLSWDFVTEAIAPDTAAQRLAGLVDSLTELDRAQDPTPLAAVLAICAEALGRTHLEPGDNLFQLGADSVTATRVVDRITREVSPAATLRMLFAHPVIADFVAELTAAAADTGDADLEEGTL